MLHFRKLPNIHAVWLLFLFILVFRPFLQRKKQKTLPFNLIFCSFYFILFVFFTPLQFSYSCFHFIVCLILLSVNKISFKNFLWFHGSFFSPAIKLMLLTSVEKFSILVLFSVLFHFNNTSMSPWRFQYFFYCYILYSIYSQSLCQKSAEWQLPIKLKYFLVFRFAGDVWSKDWTVASRLISQYTTN